MKIDLCPNRADYYSQLNNAQDPKIACQCTTVTACIDRVNSALIKKMTGKYKQPEDNLRSFIKHDSRCIEFCEKSHGLNNPAVDHPSEWADVLVFGTNLLTESNICYFDSYIGMDEIKADLMKGLPIAASMKFTKIKGHYIAVVGAEFVDDQFSNLIINDPYRDWLHDTEDGFHVIYKQADWKEHFKGYGIRFKK
jgi:hypothetical protein